LHSASSNKGFTLLELLVSLSIFAFISAMAYGGMSQVMTQRVKTEEKADKLQQLQITYTILDRDFSQLVNRSVRNAYGNTLGALVGSDGIEGVEFTRSGHANPAGFRRSSLQRVRYISEDEKLLRQTWKVLDRSPDSETVQQVLFEPVESFSLRYLDQANNWRETWPPVGGTPGATPGLPRVVEVVIETKDFGKITWLFRSPEPFTPTPPPTPVPPVPPTPP
jgi:general secretion pathway protein J